MSWIPDRYSGIAQMAWRVGMMVIMSQLAPWVDEWAPPELHRGLRGQDGRTLHERLFDDLEDARYGDLNSAGFNVDVGSVLIRYWLSQTCRLTQAGCPRWPRRCTATLLRRTTTLDGLPRRHRSGPHASMFVYCWLPQQHNCVSG